jgi:hypothetical protein
MLAECPAMALTIKRRGQAIDTFAFLVLAAAWAAGLLLLLTHRLFVTNDSISDYAHTWYIAKVLWSGGGLPYHFPQLGHGDALAYPYAFFAWTSAAIFRPVFGDWVVTLWLAAGAVATIASTVWAFPETRSRAGIAMLLANPIMVEAVILGQLPFLWGAWPWFVAIGCWRRGWIPAAILAAAAAQAGHPAVVLPLAAITVACRLPFDGRPRSLAAAYAASVTLAGPWIAMTLLSPAVSDSTLLSLAANFFGTLSLRAEVMYAPFVVVLVRHWFGRVGMLAAIPILVALNLIIVPIRHNEYAWGAFAREPSNTLNPFLESPAFTPSKTYRLLQVGDGKVGMYRLLQAGGHLDAELFPESIDRRSWPGLPAYEAFLRNRNVDAVLISNAYNERYRTNEHDLLEQLVGRGCASRTTPLPGFALYELHPLADDGGCGSG